MGPACETLNSEAIKSCDIGARKRTNGAGKQTNEKLAREKVSRLESKGWFYCFVFVVLAYRLFVARRFSVDAAASPKTLAN